MTTSESPRLLDTRLTNALPYPIAAAWAAVRRADSEAGRRTRILAAHDVLLRTLSALIAADAVRAPLPAGLLSEFGEFGRRGDGGTARFLRALTEQLAARSGPAPFLREAAQWFLDDPTPNIETPNRLARELVDLRNRRAHHDAAPDGEAAARAENAGLGDRMRALLASLGWLTGYRLVRVVRQQPAEAAPHAVSGRIQLFVGRDALPEIVPAEWEADPPLLSDRVYLVNPQADALLDLYPFLQVVDDAPDRQARLYLWKEAGRKGDVRVRHDDLDLSVWTRPRLRGRELPFAEWLRAAAGSARLHSLRDRAGTLRPVERLAGAPGGQRLAERYTVVDRVGAGGMGEVYHVTDAQTQAELALKLIRADVSRDPVLRERFVREAQVAQTLRHEHLLPVYDHGVLPDGSLYLTMPLIRGGNLAEQIQPGGRSWDAVLGFAAPILEGLAYLHERGVVHRDVKPANLLLDESGSVFVADFGIARRAGDAQLTLTGEAMGTGAYAAPEQRAGHPVDGRADVYALAVVLHELVTGRLPLDRPGESLPGPFGAWLRTLAAPVTERPGAAEALRRLRAIAEPGAKPAAAQIPRAGAPRRPRRRTLLVAGLAGLVGVGLALAAWIATRPAATGTPTAQAVAAYHAIIAAYNRADRDAFVRGFAPSLDCYYNLPNATQADALRRRQDQFLEPLGRYMYAIDELELIRERPTEVVFWQRGRNGLRDGSKPLASHEKVIVMKRLGGDWTITTEVGCSKHGCFPEPFEARNARGGPICPKPKTPAESL